MNSKPAASLFLACVLSACATSVPVLTPDSFPERARQLLEDQADLGPVALVSHLSDTDAASLAFAAEEGVRGMEVTFDPSLPADSRFRLVVTRQAGNPCIEPPGDDAMIRVAFCRDDDAVVTAQIDDEDTESEPATTHVRRATRQMFPDDYESRSGFGLFGRIGSGVSIGVGTSIGF